jgi:hypothetical protein
LFDESIPTGESVPVDKGADDEAFSGTLLVRGRTFLEITRTGPLSAMGRLASMLADVQLAKTPLERRVDALGHQIAKWVLALAAVLGVLGIMAEGLSRAPGPARRQLRDHRRRGRGRARHLREHPEVPPFPLFHEPVRGAAGGRRRRRGLLAQST